MRRRSRRTTNIQIAYIYIYIYMRRRSWRTKSANRIYIYIYTYIYIYAAQILAHNRGTTKILELAPFLVPGPGPWSLALSFNICLMEFHFWGLGRSMGRNCRRISLAHTRLRNRRYIFIYIYIYICSADPGA